MEIGLKSTIRRCKLDANDLGLIYTEIDFGVMLSSRTKISTQTLEPCEIARGILGAIRSVVCPLRPPISGMFLKFIQGFNMIALQFSHALRLGWRILTMAVRRRIG